MKLIAFYLPQFHPISENNKWWSPGFTEWTNVARARPLFPGHVQPNIPGELGFYDLRLSETRELQASLAEQHSIHGFCYYHYWFAGKKLLERPLEEIQKSGKPNFPYCVCWANGSWTAHWMGRENEILLEQTYPGLIDHKNHIKYLLKFFTDDRYIQINGKPIFIIHNPSNIPKIREFLDLWHQKSYEYLGSELFLIGIGNNISELIDFGFDSVVTYSLQSAVKDHLTPNRRFFQFIRHKLFNYPRWVIPFENLMPALIREEWSNNKVFPDVLPNWDNSPRLGRKALILSKSNPELFTKVLIYAIKSVMNRPINEQLIFIKSWNEWAEGNYLEPDLINNRSFLESIKKVMKNYEN